MAAEIYYVFKAKFIRKVDENENFDFVDVEEIFENDNPIIARNKAFEYYQNYIDVLLQTKDFEYENHKQTKENLKSFITLEYSPKKINQLIEEEIKANIDTFFYKDRNIIEQRKTAKLWIDFREEILGIGVYFVDKNTTEDLLKYQNYIHGIGFDIYADSIMSNLDEEFEIYKKFNYDTDNQEMEVLYCNMGEWAEGYLGNGEWLDDSYFEPNLYTILRTPFDWTGLDYVAEPDNIEEADDTEEPEDETSILPNINELIKQGESNQLEFKPSLLYNFTTQKAGISIKAIIAKTICAFLNSNGGYLLIGVKDNQEVCGLEYDYSLYTGENGSNPKDYFNLEFDNMLKHFFPSSIISKINGRIYTYDSGEDIYFVKVFPSKKPVFINGQYGKEFYVRRTASSIQIKDTEEIVEYCLEKWGK